MKPPTRWPDEVYRRLLVDMHVPDWHPDLLSHFDPVEYVETIAKAGFQSFEQYAISCAGLCLWPTKVGRVHGAMKGRDFFGEVLEECDRHGLHKVCYFHVIWDNWAYEEHPDWRIRPAGGDEGIMQGRYGYACPSSPYADYIRELLRELVGAYEFECIFIDMTIWPDVCYCPHCTARYRREYGAEPPRIVDWDDPEWRQFQKAREAWLLEFANDMTNTIKEIRPIHVHHQFSTVFRHWKAGVSLAMAEACDFVGGDFYGGPGSHSLACKAYVSLSRRKPFEFMTSRTVHVVDHVTVKTAAQLRLESFIPTLHSASLMLIDGIDADGTLNPAAYRLMGDLNAEHAPYEPFLGGEMLADVAVYFDKNSVYNPDENGVHVTELNAVERSPHLDAVGGAANILREGHIPFGLVTNATLDQLNQYRAVMVPNVLEMTREQAGRFRQFVEEGGALYASGPSSLDRFDPDGPRYLLEDVFGVRYTGRLGTAVTFLTPTDDAVAEKIWPQDHLIYSGSSPNDWSQDHSVATGAMVRADALPGAEVLATVTLPFVEPEAGHAIGSRFAAIISDPPALTPGEDPGLVVNSFGKGKAVWVAAPIEAGVEPVNAALVLSLLKRVLPGPYKFEADTHPSVEMTLFHQEEESRLLVGLLTMQTQHPAIPVGAKVRVQLPAGRRATRVVRAPDGATMPFEEAGDYVEIGFESFDSLVMAHVEYE